MYNKGRVPKGTVLCLQNVPFSSLSHLSSSLLFPSTSRTTQNSRKGGGGAEKAREMGDEDDDNRPLFVGNLDPYLRAKELTELFEKKGKVKKIDLKTGFAFVFMETKEDAEEALREYNNYEWEPNHRRVMKVEWAKGDGSVKKREDDRRGVAQNNPCDTLFVVNFDPNRTRTRDLEKTFEPYGKIKRVEIKRNYAFVQFSTVEEATEARIALNGKLVDDREITVEYVARDQNRDRSRSPRRRSRSPPRRYGGGGRGGRDSYRGGRRERSRSPRSRSRSRSRDRRRR